MIADLTTEWEQWAQKACAERIAGIHKALAALQDSDETNDADSRKTLQEITAYFKAHPELQSPKIRAQVENAKNDAPIVMSAAEGAITSWLTGAEFECENRQDLGFLGSRQALVLPGKGKILLRSNRGLPETFGLDIHAMSGTNGIIMLSPLSNLPNPVRRPLVRESQADRLLDSPMAIIRSDWTRIYHPENLNLREFVQACVGIIHKGESELPLLLRKFGPVKVACEGPDSGQMRLEWKTGKLTIRLKEETFTCQHNPRDQALTIMWFSRPGTHASLIMQKAK
jgi:hypothetical protein